MYQSLNFMIDEFKKISKYIMIAKTNIYVTIKLINPVIIVVIIYNNR